MEDILHDLIMWMSTTEVRVTIAFILHKTGTYINNTDNQSLEPKMEFEKGKRKLRSPSDGLGTQKRITLTLGEKYVQLSATFDLEFI